MTTNPAQIQHKFTLMPTYGGYGDDGALPTEQHSKSAANTTPYSMRHSGDLFVLHFIRFIVVCSIRLPLLTQFFPRALRSGVFFGKGRHICMIWCVHPAPSNQPHHRTAIRPLTSHGTTRRVPHITMHRTRIQAK